jgi:hypothetical protein
VTVSQSVGGAVLGPSRLPPARPNFCEVGGCDNRSQIQLAHPRKTVVLWVCLRCTQELQAAGWQAADGIGGVKR